MHSWARRRSPVVKVQVLAHYSRKGPTNTAKSHAFATSSQGFRAVTSEGAGTYRCNGIAELIVKMATENPRWGYTRIQGALKHLELFVGRSTVARVLVEHGLLPGGAKFKVLAMSPAYMPNSPTHCQTSRRVGQASTRAR